MPQRFPSISGLLKALLLPISLHGTTHAQQHYRINRIQSPVELIAKVGINDRGDIFIDGRSSGGGWLKPAGGEWEQVVVDSESVIVNLVSNTGKVTGSHLSNPRGSDCENFPRTDSPKGCLAVYKGSRYWLYSTNFRSPQRRTQARCRCECVSELRTCESPSLEASRHPSPSASVRPLAQCRSGCTRPLYSESVSSARPR